MSCFLLSFVAAETPVEVAVNGVDKVDTYDLNFVKRSLTVSFKPYRSGSCTQEFKGGVRS